MYTCNIARLVKLLDEELDQEGKLEVLDHLEGCDICFDALYLIWRERNRALFERRPDGKEGEAA